MANIFLANSISGWIVLIFNSIQIYLSGHHQAGKQSSVIQYLQVI